jgi:hypothetical protein
LLTCTPHHPSIQISTHILIVAKHTFGVAESSSSGSITSLLGAGVKFWAGFFLIDDLVSAARCAGDDAGSAGGAALRGAVEGVAGEDFWKNPKIDR